MVRVVILRGKGEKIRAIKCLHFDKLDDASRWARDMLNQLLAWGKEGFADLYECQDRYSPSERLITTIKWDSIQEHPVG